MNAAWFIAAMAMSGAALSDEIVFAPEGFSHCVTCHGVELAGNRSVESPNLSVLDDWYVESQLIAFAEGWRGHREDVQGMEMQPMAAALDSGQRSAAVEFVTAVPDRNAKPTVDGDFAAGETLYAACAACHGASGEGNAALKAPRLAGQSDWYLVRQLRNFKTGIRGAAASDLLGAQMRAAADTLADDTDMRDVVAYINALGSR